MVPDIPPHSPATPHKTRTRTVRFHDGPVLDQLYD